MFLKSTFSNFELVGKWEFGIWVFDVMVPYLVKIVWPLPQFKYSIIGDTNYVIVENRKSTILLREKQTA